MKRKKTIFDLNSREFNDLDKEFMCTYAGKIIVIFTTLMWIFPLFLYLFDFVLELIDVFIDKSTDYFVFPFANTVTVLVIIMISGVIRCGFLMHYYQVKK